ncbi:hypothetical protein [Clostridium sp. Cult1]|uniref:hypothetical protein n=1 Tax=Clostridium sp. Cult1 TaxID=2079002 RepID=UPI001F174D58|nr:hypothetical protein [Clostridium sp. Cult1]MCF6462203.1 hypothetical protein [Clostridium sp. Cult1]
MKQKLNIIIFLLIIPLVLVSCSSNSSNNSLNVDNDLTDDEVIGNKINEEDIVGQILINNDGSNTTLEELSIKEVRSDGTRILDGRFSEYGYPDKEDFDGVSVKEIIEKTLEQANRTDNYSVHFSGYQELPMGTDQFDIYYDQDESGRFRVTHETREYLTRESDFAMTVFNGEKYTCLLPEYFRGDELNLPSGLSGSEVFEILKNQYMYGMDTNSGIAEGTNLEELVHQYPRIAVPALNESISFLEIFSESDMGSFIRFKDGFKRGHAHYFDEDEDVYHIMYINKNLDNPENATEFNFYINKDTYLIRFQQGSMGELQYTSTLESYSTDNEYSDEFFSLEDF